MSLPLPVSVPRSYGEVSNKLSALNAVAGREIANQLCVERTGMCVEDHIAMQDELDLGRLVVSSARILQVLLDAMVIEVINRGVVAVIDTIQWNHELQRTTSKFFPRKKDGQAKAFQVFYRELVQRSIKRDS